MGKIAAGVIVISLILICAGSVFSAEDQGCGLFVSAIQDPPVLTSRQAISDLVDFAKSANVKDIYIQVHYANRAWFKSKIADSRVYEDCLDKIPEDPLRLIIDRAHSSGIKVHAWINLLSLGNNKVAPLLAKYGTDILTRNTKEKRSLEDYMVDCQYFLEPGDERVRGALSELVGEAVEKYPELDGVLFDYARYPDKDPAYGHTEANLAAFKAATGRQAADECDETWRDWKRGRVSSLVEMLARKARETRPGMAVSVTGCMPYTRAYHEAFQDWPSWADSGKVDFVILMNYSANPEEFGRWTARAKEKVVNFGKIRIAVGAYKLKGCSETFRSELEACSGSGAGGCVIFHYGSLVEDPALAETFKGRGGVYAKPS